MKLDASLAALAVEAFLSEHRRCWQPYEDGLTSEAEGSILSLECSCGAVLALRRES